MCELLNLPELLLEQILLNLSYDEIAKCRIVCKHFDRICKKLLNKGFVSVEKYHAYCLKAVKAQLPRRESERRNHPLARHCDILAAIETRISMLSMTFTKYIDVGLCCFIPGKVIDEIFRVLFFIKGAQTPPRAHEILQELRDISSMAMEHFDEKIVPVLKQTLSSITTNSVHSYPLSGSCLVASTSTRSMGQEKIRLEFHKIHAQTRIYWKSLTCMKKTAYKMKLKVRKQSYQLNCQAHKLREQEAKLVEQEAKLAEQDSQIAELKKHIEEWDHKFGDMAAELSRQRDGATPPTTTSNLPKSEPGSDDKTCLRKKRKLRSTTALDSSSIEVKKQKV